MCTTDCGLWDEESYVPRRILRLSKPWSGGVDSDLLGVQVVWWGLRNWRWNLLGPWPPTIFPIYAWRANVGPVEIRKWA